MANRDAREAGFSRRIGSGMVAAAWIAGLALLTLLFTDLLSGQRNPNSEVISRQTGESTEIILEQNRGGHYVASAGINGVPVEVMLDTGASLVSIPEHLAGEMGLERGPEMRVVTANGTVSVYGTRLDEVRLGDILLRDIRATINPHMREDFVLLGMSFLRQLEFEQTNERLLLRQSP